MSLFGKKKKRSSVGKIYKTTDGNLGNKSKSKKPRNVIAVEQRKSDGAIAVAKIHSKKGKNAADRSKYIHGVTLSPDKHPALKEPSIVEKRAIFGKKDGKNYSPLYPQMMVDTGDRLKEQEIRKVRKGIQHDTKEHRIAYEKVKKRWKKNFKK